jgi:hypothetical protein
MKMVVFGKEFYEISINVLTVEFQSDNMTYETGFIKPFKI